MKPIKAVYVIILVIVFAAAGFYGGMTYQKSQRLNFAVGANGGNAAFNGAGGGRFGNRGMGFQGGASAMRPISGQIVSSGNNTITVKLSDGSSKIVDISNSTMINKSTKGSSSDLTSGQQVTAFGTTNSDGSITAQAVNVGNGNNGMFRMRQGGNQPTGTQQ
ncbi:MAG TPA: hypothetical protein VLF93_05320 [Candidatus Saccharimonadales bacterium]|nr:hypothetical protein [Candidatus Saccharimonadales bacterium]